MNWLRHLARPRVLAALAFAFAFVPAWLAVVTYRDAREKDARLFQTSAQVLGEQLQRAFERNTYYLGVMRGQAAGLDDAALASGRMVSGYDWLSKLPHLLGFAYAETTEGRLLIRWKSEERTPLPAIGDDLAVNAPVAAVLSETERKRSMAVEKLAVPMSAPANGGTRPDARAIAAQREQTMDALFPTSALPFEGRRILLLLPVPRQPERTIRGYIAAWVDTSAHCRDTALPLLRDGVLTALPLAPGEGVPEGTTRVEIFDARAPWAAAIARGPRFSQEYGAPAPWLAFLAVGVSAVPLLALAALAGRAGKLRAALDAEREVAERQRFFTQSVSHEFRTPLGVIQSGADLLDRYAANLTPERRAEVLAEIKDNTRLMTEMVEGVLLLGRIESSKLTCTPQSVNLAEFCHAAARKITNASPGVIHITAPNTGAALDTTLLGSVLENLLTNAVKYSPPGKPVALSAALESGRVTFTVRDEGIGIPADELPRTCDPFHRCKNVGDTPGSGLGLAIAQRCAGHHGGKLRIESAIGNGTTVVVTIPQA